MTEQTMIESVRSEVAASMARAGLPDDASEADKCARALIEIMRDFMLKAVLSPACAPYISPEAGAAMVKRAFEEALREPLP